MLDGSGSYDPDYPDDDIISYSWDFGDSTTGTEVSPTHTYTAGSYTVTLTVTDNCGATDTATTTVTVSSENIPEFSTIALPVTAILGLLFLFNHRKRRKED
jgi:PKD repeat protein